MRSATTLLLAAGVLLLATPALARDKSASHARFDDHFRKYSKHYFGVGTDWHWFKSQAMAESNLNPLAQSAVKARGIMQLMPATYAELQQKNPEFGAITDPRWNIAAGIRYDKNLWDRLGDVSNEAERRRFMFASYNAGAATIRRARQVAATQMGNGAEWSSIASVAPRVPRWRHVETLSYIKRIENTRDLLGPAPH
jgi:membrane-bound lytic murein transglycosylase F